MGKQDKITEKSKHKPKNYKNYKVQNDNIKT